MPVIAMPDELRPPLRAKTWGVAERTNDNELNGHSSDWVGANGGSPLQEFDVQHLQFKTKLNDEQGRSARGGFARND